MRSQLNERKISSPGIWRRPCPSAEAARSRMPARCSKPMPRRSPLAHSTARRTSAARQRPREDRPACPTRSSTAGGSKIRWRVRQSRQFGLPIGLLGLRPVGGVGQGFGQGGIPVASQLRQQFVPDAIAGEGACRHWWSRCARRYRARAGIARSPGAIDFEQRAHDASSCDRADAGQSGGPGAAQETEEHGFGLIGAGMAGGDAIHGSASR